MPRLVPRTTVSLLLGALAFGLLTACGDVLVLKPGDPIEFVQQPETSRVLAADGEQLAALHTEQDRRDVALSDIPDALAAAVVAVEDRRFFLHQGVDVPAIGRAVVRNVEAGTIEEGGSTITQQYVKNTMVGPARTLERKVKEAALAWQLEQRYSKEEILERYLNSIYFGHGAYGVHAASLRYFDKPAHKLEMAESALLAGLIASPATFDPYDHPERARLRRRVVLDALVNTGNLDAPEAQRLAAAPLRLAPLERDEFIAPYAVEEVKRQIAADSTFDMLGATSDERLNALFTDGLVVTTTIDPAVQQAAERAVQETLGKVAGPSAAIVSLDPGSGAIRALVGGRDFYGAREESARFNLATQGRRQAGSAFKPIVLAAALSRGTRLDTKFAGGSQVTIEDPTCSGPKGPWQPTNYAGIDYPELTLREATVKSVNTVYARLVADLGPDAVVDTARSLGLGGDLEAVCAIALGTEEVTPLGLTAAYQPFATLGTFHAPHLVERIETRDGEVLYEHESRGEQVLDEAVAYLVSQTLADVVSRGTGVRASIGRPQAGKTGTTDSNADAWFVGYTPDLVAGVWVGFPTGRTPMEPPATPITVEGGTWPAEIWATFAREALRDVAAEPFPIPDVELVTVKVDITRNCLPNPYTPPDLVESRRYVDGTQPTEVCREPTGPAVSDVPEVTGLTRNIAVRLLESRGFAVDERPIASAVYPPGYVTAQDPDPGDDVTEGDAVLIWVSVHSRERATVPDVVGLDVDAARSRLEADGWVVEVQEGCRPGGCSEDLAPGTVHEQDPEGGDRTELYAVVTLRVVPDG